MPAPPPPMVSEAQAGIVSVEGWGGTTQTELSGNKIKGLFHWGGDKKLRTPKNRAQIWCPSIPPGLCAQDRYCCTPFLFPHPPHFIP